MTHTSEPANGWLSRNTPAVALFRCVVGGAVFASEGLQKFLHAAQLGSGRFAKLGLPFADVLGPTVGAIEIACGLAIVVGWRLRLATLPLIGVMLGAIVSTKIPILLGTELFGLTLRELPRYGLLMMLHEARTDFAMLASLLLLSRYGHRDDAGAHANESLLAAAH